MKTTTTLFLKGAFIAVMLIPVCGITNGQIMKYGNGINNQVALAEDQSSATAVNGSQSNSSTGLGHAAPTIGFSMAPNPADDFITIRMANITVGFRVSIFNSSGMRVYDKAYPAYIEAVGVDIAGFATGIYTVMAQTTSNIYTQRLSVR